MAFLNQENTKTLLENFEDPISKYNVTELYISSHKFLLSMDCGLFLILAAFFSYSIYCLSCHNSLQHINTYYKKTPIHYLDENYSNSLVQYILSSDNDINEKDYCGRTPLHISAENGNTSFAKLLLKRGAKIDVKTDTGQTPLHISAEKGHTDFVDLLLKWKANVNEYNDIYRKTALHMCIEKGHEETADVLLAAGAKVNLVDMYGKTALHYAVCRGSKKLILSILHKGAAVNRKDIQGNTALHYCARDGKNAIVAFLLNAGASANIRDNNGKTALHYAAYYGHNETVLTLVKVPDFIDTGDNCGKTALHDGSFGGYAKVVKTLLEAGAGVDVRDQFGKTPLHCSAEMNCAHVIRTLIQNGANIDLTDASGLTALDMAILKSNDDAVAVLRRHSTQSTHLNLDKSEAYSRFVNVKHTIVQQSRFSQFSKPSNPGFIKIISSTHNKEGRGLNLETPGKVNSGSRLSKHEDIRETSLLDTERVTMPTTRSHTTVETEPIYYNNTTTRSNICKHVRPTGMNPDKSTIRNKTSIDVNVPRTATLKSFTVYRSTASTAPSIRNHRKHVTDSNKKLMATGTSLTQMVATPLENTTPTSGTTPTTTSTTTPTSITTTNATPTTVTTPTTDTSPTTYTTPTTDTATTTDISPTSDITPTTAPTIDATPTTDTTLVSDSISAIDTVPITHKIPATVSRPISYTKQNSDLTLTTDRTKFSNTTPISSKSTTKTLCDDTAGNNDTETLTNSADGTHLKRSQNFMSNDEINQTYPDLKYANVASSTTNSPRMENAPGSPSPLHLQENLTQSNLETLGETFEKHEEMLDDADSGQENSVGQSQMNDKRNMLVHRATTCTRSIVKRKKRKGTTVIKYVKKYTSYNIGQMNINNVDYLTTNGNQNFFLRKS